MKSEEHMKEYRQTLINLLPKARGTDAKKLVKTYIAHMDYFLDDDMPITELQQRIKDIMK